MKIGISFLPCGSAFSGGGAQVAVHLAELFVLLGHEVSLISLVPGRVWFDDCVTLPELAGFKCLEAAHVQQDEDKQELFIDTLGYMTKDSRAALGKRCVVFVRSAPVLADQEGAVYGMNTFITNYEGVSEVWTWRGWDQGELEYLQVLSGLHVRELPFVWFPTLVEIYRREAGLGEWHSSSSGKGACHIMETNTKISSSCHVPLMICQHTGQVGCVVHCSEHIVDGKYFSENFKKHMDIEGVKWVGRQRVADLLREEGSFILSHMRFRELRPLLLDCVWLGIPVVHNSPWLRNFGHGYEQLYYESNSISGGSAAISRLGSWQSDSGTADALLKKVSALGEADVSLYTDALMWARTGGTIGVGGDELIIQFMDFWTGFQPHYNFFIHLLQEGLRSAGRATQVIGVGEDWVGRADLIIFGPYTDKWQSAAPDIPKVHFTGEWSPEVRGPGVFLNLGFSLDEGKEYIRLPLWVLYINWFGADSQRLVNPTLLELEEVTSIGTREGWTDRKKFCAFVVSNPTCQERNAAFKELCGWRSVDAAGALFNNVGYRLEGGQGGGGGERIKIDFYKDYKYVLCYENRLMPGYTTEKLLHAKAAGCVPIYWGSGDDFEKEGFLNMTGRSESVSVAVKDNLESGAAEKMAGVPALSAEKVEWCRRLLSRVAKSILGKVCGEEVACGGLLGRGLPAFAAAAASAAAVKPLNFQKFILVSSASRETERELPVWLESAKHVTQRFPEARILVRWTGGAVDWAAAKYPHVTFIPAITSLCVDVCQWLAEGEVALILHVPISLALTQLPVELMAMALAGEGGTYSVQGTEILCFKGARNMASLLRGRRIVSWSDCAHNFKEHAPQVCKGIDTCSLINLKRRADRLERFYASHPEMKKRQVEIVEAFDGRELKLGPNLVRLFLNNNFGWKKGAIGCNLSHLSVWKKLADSGYGSSALILEDDVKFNDESWPTMLESAIKAAPKDYDVLYLGGLLPPNVDGWYAVKEGVNPWWSRIGLNRHFGQVEPSGFYHFCTYSYILSQAGAKKLLTIIEKEDGFKNVVDHQMLHSWKDLNIYVSDPFLTGCYQESDPMYKASNFNDLNRTDVIDSDIWTSRDCFLLDGSTQISMRLDIGAALAEAKACGEANPVANPVENYEIVCFSDELINIFEGKWLAHIFGSETAFKNVKGIYPDVGQIYENSIIVYQGREKRQVEAMACYLGALEERGWSCGVIHLSDEFATDDLTFYGREGVRWIIRNYWRDGLTNKTMVIPLGFHRQPKNSKPLSERQLAWSFHGTAWGRWQGRHDMLRVLEGVEPHRSYVRGAWEEPMSEESAMLADMEDSWIVPCPEGNNTESFRIYEALEAGSFPVLVDEGRSDWSTHFYLWIQKAMPSLCILRSWDDALDIFRQAKEEPMAFEARRDRLVGEWAAWKAALRTLVRNKV